MARDPGALRGTGDPTPVDLPGGAPPVLALHGFGATPDEVRLVVEVATRLRLRAHAPLLPGHGTHANELAKTGWNDWARAAEEALDRIVQGGATAVVAGLSLGSLLAAHLAATRPRHVRGLVMLANATRLVVPFPDWPLRVFDRVGYREFSVPKWGADIADPEARRTQLTYGVQPVGPAIEVLRAGERIERLLPQIGCPALVAHGRGDHVCPVANAERAYRLLGSTDKQLLILPRSYHIVTRDYDRELLRSELLTFFQRLC